MKTTMGQLVDPTAPLEALCGDFEFIEGPVWHADCLYFSDIPQSKRYEWSAAAGLREVSGDTNKGNGMDIDADGGLLVCEHTTSAITRFPDPSSDDGRRVVASHHDGMELNSPNDVVCAPDGSFYFTDPVYGRTVESVGLLRDVQLRFRGVLRVPRGAGPEETQVVADDFDGPNGLCFSPGLQFLYVNDTPRKHIRRFTVEPDGSLRGGEVFAVLSGGPAWLDGMECDASGNVWVTGGKGIWVIDPDGVSIGEIPVPAPVGSLGWGGEGFNELFITAGTTLYRIRTKVRGFHPFD